MPRQPGNPLLHLPFLLIAALLMAAGCQGTQSDPAADQGRWGDQQASASPDYLGDTASFFVKLWPFKAQEPVTPTRVTVSRYRVEDLKAKEPHKLDEQVLEIDLVSGRASIVDVDGRAYPLQLDAATVEQHRNDLHTTAWGGEHKADKNAADVVFYHIVAERPDKRELAQGLWPVPGKSTPEALAHLIDTFESAQRRIKPLSQTVNLIP